MSIPRRRRLSTWLNLFSMIFAAAMIYIPQIGLEPELAKQIQLGFSVFIAAAQFYKQQESKNDINAD
jgi:hypothetical protein